MAVEPVAEREVVLERFDEIDPEELRRFVETVEQDYEVRLIVKPQPPSAE